jgi:hypothetical protein
LQEYNQYQVGAYWPTHTLQHWSKLPTPCSLVSGVACIQQRQAAQQQPSHSRHFEAGWSDCLIVGGYLKPPQLLYILWPRKERAIKSQRFANYTYPEFYADSLPPTCSSEATLVNWATLLRKACHSRNKIINQRNFLDTHCKITASTFQYTGYITCIFRKASSSERATKYLSLPGRLVG